jgi:hypothetical protein
MSDGIETRDVMVSHQQEWHGKAKVIPVGTPITEANCEICYPMTKQPTFLRQPDGAYKEDGQFRIVSMDDNLPIGDSVGKGYVIVDNCERIEGAMKVCKNHNGTLESAGTVKNREIGFCSIQVDAPITIAGETTTLYLNRVWGHGGTKGLVDKLAITKQVCQNTIQMSLAEYSDFATSARHTAGSIRQMGDLSKTFAAYKKLTGEYKTLMEEWATTKVSPEKARQIFAGFIVKNNDATEVSTRSANIIEELVLLFRLGKGNTGKTMADVFNAFTDYYTHKSAGDNLWKQFESSEFGSGLDNKLSAFKLLKGDKLRGLGNLNEVIARGKKVIALV